MLGFYENFPEGVHRIQLFTSKLPNKKLQQKLIHVVGEVNRKKFSFEEVANPTMPDCTLIFELGIADATSFSFVGEEETKKTLDVLKKETFQVMDFFCAIRYYKTEKGKKTPLKFDYYMVRFGFSKDAELELRVFHERGPRYISPEDIANFFVSQIGKGSSKRILKPVETD